MSASSSIGANINYLKSTKKRDTRKKVIYI